MAGIPWRAPTTGAGGEPSHRNTFYGVTVVPSGDLLNIEFRWQGNSAVEDHCGRSGPERIESTLTLVEGDGEDGASRSEMGGTFKCNGLISFGFGLNREVQLGWRRNEVIRTLAATSTTRRASVHARHP